jgi:hypothetical protein
MTCVIVEHGHFSGEHQVENVCPILCVLSVESSLVQKTKALFRAAELHANHVLRKVLWLICIALGISSMGSKSIPQSAMPHVILFLKMHCPKREGIFLGKQRQNSNF